MDEKVNTWARKIRKWKKVRSLLHAFLISHTLLETCRSDRKTGRARKLETRKGPCARLWRRPSE